MIFRQFAEAVAKKLLFAQKAFEEQNCNFSSFQNSGEDLSNEVSNFDNIHMYHMYTHTHTHMYIYNDSVPDTNNDHHIITTMHQFKRTALTSFF